MSKPYIRQNDCSEILAITESGSMVLVKSYRPELGCYAYELPSGTLKKGEDPKAAAIRELEEETGYVAGRMSHLFSGHPLLGYSDCRLHFFLATGLRKRRQRLEEDESIVVEEFKPGQVLGMLKAGKIRDLNVITALHHYYYFLDQGRMGAGYPDPK